MLIIFTGNGKGKTTAALGQALRAIGNRKKVLMVQFIKGPWRSGEDVSCQRLSPDLHIEKTGAGFVGICNDPLPHETHCQAAREGLTYAHAQAERKTWNIIILDEIWNALHLKLLTTQEIQEFIEKHTTSLEHIIMTGRNCPQSFIDQADLVTEMTEIKHPFQHKEKATKGVEF